MNAPGFFRSISLFISVTVFPGRRDGFRGFYYLCRQNVSYRRIDYCPGPVAKHDRDFRFKPKKEKSNLKAILAP